MHPSLTHPPYAFKRLGTAILDLLYPPSCASCGADGAWWCADCRRLIERTPCDPCPRCLSAETDHDRQTCGGALPFSGVAVTGFYHSPPLRKAIGDLKFRGVTAARGDLAVYLCDVRAHRREALPWAGEPFIAIQPVPLAPMRERERGFNQSRLVAETLKETWMPEAGIVSRLSRVSSRTPQANINDHALRSANVTGDFVAPSRISHPILLVDDVVTSGSTAGEAARALIAAGAPRVYLFALALGA